MNKRTKWSYCIGATGRDAAYALVSMYLITYVQYTVNLTVAQFAVISACMVVCLLWDAVNDPLMSILVENAQLKQGKYKPWIMLGAILNAAVIIALFSVRLEGWAFVAFFGVGYLLWGMTYTMNDIAYWGMLPSFSSDTEVRNSLVSLMSVFVCIGQFAVAGIVPTIIAGNAINAYRTVAICVGAGFILFQALTVFGTTEAPRREAEEKLTLKGMMEVFKRNDQLIVMGISTFLYNIGSSLLLMFGINFFYVEYGYSESGNLIFLFTVMYGLGMLISQAAYASLAKKFTWNQMLMASVIGMVVGYVGILGYGYVLPRNLILLNGLGLLIFLAQGLFLSITVVLLNNTIEYDEYRFGERRESTISAVKSFSTKLAGAVNQGLVALVLIISGIYAISRNVSGLEIEVGKGALTSDEARTMADGFLAEVQRGQAFTLRLGMCLLPIILIVASWLIIKKKYTLHEEAYAELVEKLRNKETE